MDLAEVERAARRAHAHQRDKAGRPYVEHLAAVAGRVDERGGTDDQIAAAWLHDALEDGVLSAQDLDGLGVTRAAREIVAAVTRRHGEPPEEYAARIRTTPGALLVKEADLAHNADPARLALLDAETRERLTVKYRRMRSLLGL